MNGRRLLLTLSNNTREYLNKMDTIFYQFSVSHYCEKARWALDYKGVQYQVKDLLPGLHILTLRKKVKGTSLPVLSMNGVYVQGSDQIIDFLDQTVATKPLTPVDAVLRTEAENWETFAANQLGTPYSVFYYSNMLQNPELLRQRYIQTSPWYGSLYYAITFNRISQRIRELYNINTNSAQQARATIEVGLQKLEHHLQSRSYLVGDQFTRADLSVAALISPLALPPQLAYNRLPAHPAMVELRKHFAGSPVIQWVNDIYQTHRSYLE